MEAPKKDQPDVKPESAREQGTGDWVVTPLLYVTAAMPGYLAAETTVRKCSYKNFAKHGIFNDLQEERAKQYDALMKGVAEGRVTNVTAPVKAMEESYRDAVRGRFQSMGLHNVLDYWKTLQRNQKVEALVMGATVSGIALGAMLALTNNQVLEEQMAKAMQRDDEPPVR